MIQFSEVRKTFGVQLALDGLSFRIESGAITGFIGPNGSGKTTSLRLMLGLFHPDSGSVTVLGQAPGPHIADSVGYLPEERGLYRRMRVGEVIRYYARLKGAVVPHAFLEQWYERLGIAEHAGKRVEQLSKGTAQKVQLLAAIAHRPKLVILDEPFTGLDPVSTEHVREAIMTLQGDGTSVILSTHDMNIADRMCDNIIMLNRGRKALDGNRAQLRERFGSKTIKITVTNPRLSALPGVIRTLDLGSYQELVLEDDANPQVILKQLLEQTEVTRFEVSCPSLHDIFLRLAE